MDAAVEAAVVRPSFFARMYNSIRFPYRHDPLFSVVFFGSVFVPLVMFSYLSDGSESPKLFIWLLCTGVALVLIARAVMVRWRLPKFLSVLFGVYIAATLISTIFSLGPLVSLVGWYSRFTSSLLFSCLWVSWIIILTLTLDRQKIIFLLKALTVAGLAVAVYGIFQQQGIGFYGGINQPIRSLAPSFLGNPNFSSMFLAGIIPLAIASLVVAPSRRARYVYGVSIIVMVWALMGFSSRGAIVGMLAAVAAFGVLAAYLDRKRWLFGGLMVFILVAAGFFYTFYIVNRPDTAQEVVSLSDQTSSFRWLAWNDALEIIRDQPLTGTGPGNFLAGFRLLGDQALALNERFDDPHNIFLHIGGSVGLPALAAFLGILVFVVVRGWLALRVTRDPLIVGLVASLAGVLAAGSFNPVTIPLWQLMALALAGIIVLSYQAKGYPVPRWFKPVGITVACALFVYCAGFVAADALTYQVFTSYNNKQYPKTVRYAQLTRYLNPVLTLPRQYEIAARIRLGYDPVRTRELIANTERLNPKLADLQRRQAVLFFMLYTQTNEEQDKRGIYDAIEQTFLLEPNHAQTEGTFAYSYFRLDDYEHMIGHLRRALILNPNDFYSWILLARHYQLQDDKPKMLFALEKAYGINPETIVFKNFLQTIRAADSVKDIHFPVVFPPVAI